MENYMKEKKGARMQTAACDRIHVTEVTSDFSLPDYQPEIKRLLRVSATVSPPDKYVGAGSAELSGTVDYRILYAGNDGALYTSSQSEEYRFTVPVELPAEMDTSGGLICDAETVAELAVGRVSAPRKCTVKCRLRSRVRILGEQLMEARITGATEESLQRLCDSVECAESFVGVGETLQLADEIMCAPEEGDLRVIDAEGAVFVSEATAGSGTVNCRGEVALTLLCCRDGSDQAPHVLTRRIPFSDAVAVDGAEVNCQATASGVCRELHVTVEEGRILCDVGVCLTARAQRNVAQSFVRDVYSTTAGGETAYTAHRAARAIKCVNGNFSIGFTLPLESAGIRAGAELIDVAILPSVTSVTNENGKYVLTGRARCQVLLRENGEYTVQEIEQPFRYETDGSETVADYDATVGVISCRGRIDGERIGVDAELSVSAALRGETQFQMISEANFDTPVCEKGAVYTVCYPAREDTLWSVAKRYHRSVTSLAETNALPTAPAADAPDSLAGVRYLLV